VAALGLDSRPDGWTQTGATSEYFVTQDVRFLDAGTVQVTWGIQSNPPLKAQPEFGVQGAIYPGQAELIRGEVADGEAILIFGKTYPNIFLKRDAHFVARTRWEFANSLVAGSGFRCDESLATLVPDDDGWHPALENSESACWWLKTCPQPAASGWSVDLTIDFSLGETEDLTPIPVHHVSEEVSHFDYDALPLAEPNTLYWNRKLRQAMTTIIAAGVCHPGYGAFSEELGLLASIPNWSSTVWFWDHFISAVAIGAFRSEWMTSAVRCILQHTSDERIGPGILLAFPRYGSDDHMVDCYAPIASWAVLKAWRAYDRRPDLEGIYPLLCEHHEGWFRHCDRDGDGIPEWRNSGNPADDSPRFDPYAPNVGDACFELPPFPSADLCAYLLLDARCLKYFAAELGLLKEIDRWETRADLLRKQLLEQHWDADELFFHDRTPEGDLYRVKTFFGLLPLWADPDLLPRGVARAAVKRHLLNPAEFWGEVPFPSVAYDEPTYDPLGYWRGRMWGHVYFWNTELLQLLGFSEEANEACRRYLRVAAAHKESMENFPSDTGLLHHRTIRSYNWCGCTTVYFLLGWHRTPVQLRL
jgi:hypothetical protein